MSDEKQDVSHICNGTRVSKPKVRTQDEWEKEGHPYVSIQCPHCNGTGNYKS